MLLQNIPLYNFGNGAFMIGLFAVVCVGLVIALFMLMNGPKKSPEQDQETNTAAANQVQEKLEGNKQQENV